ncbi:unannotated protein [freshwater metagenome]|uniref:Unannotated protein n=1 Tax=freshwater metagenome TaxID=449393 RepID=A0A6J6IM12_9ZZZZ|nr:DUF3071 domain-containing protein [Actinomycetota bacterium]
MQDIRLVDNDGEYLNLETQGGEKFRLVLDDSLRSAIKRDSQVSLDSVSISPREIQDEVRAGSSAEEVANRHSVPLDYVEKFALTVVDEIGHIIASAQAVRISVEADRYSEASQVEFGEVLESRLRANEATNASWTASKREGSPWMVSVTYESPQGSKSATWSFDQRKLVLSPENEAAVKLSAGDFSAVTSSPKLRQLEPTVDSTKVIELPRVEADEPITEAPVYIAPVAPVSSIEELTRSSLQAVEEAVEEVQQTEAEALSPTADLLEALRKKRANANAASPVESKAISEPEHYFPTVETHEDSLEANGSTASVEEVAPAPVTPPAKKGRPSMPSWDEIVFGTKTDD